MAPNIVLLHGFTHTRASWDPVVAALPESYRALAPDIRGHGTASDADPVSLEAVLADLSAIAPTRFSLVGYSMGGRIALHAALTMTERIERLIVIGASPGIADPGEREERRRADEQLANELERMSIESFAGCWAETPVLAGQSERVRAAAHADRLRNTPAGLGRALRNLGTGALPSLWERLPELPRAELLIGQRDDKFRTIADQMAAAIPGASVNPIPGAGHAVHLEAPEAVADVIASRTTG